MGGAVTAVARAAAALRLASTLYDDDDAVPQSGLAIILSSRSLVGLRLDQALAIARRSQFVQSDD